MVAGGASGCAAGIPAALAAHHRTGGARSVHVSLQQASMGCTESRSAEFLDASWVMPMSATTSARTDVIAAVHRSPFMAVLALTGGGSQALADLCVVPGASRTVLEALVPYGDRSLRAFLGAAPHRAVSAETGAALARQACVRALALRPTDDLPVLGLACTAALVTDRPRKGAHRAHVGVCRGGSVEVHSVTLEKNARSREGEERVVADMVLAVLGRACGLDPAAWDALLPAEKVAIRLM